MTLSNGENPLFPLKENDLASSWNEEEGVKGKPRRGRIHEIQEESTGGLGVGGEL